MKLHVLMLALLLAGCAKSPAPAPAPTPGSGNGPGQEPNPNPNPNPGPGTDPGPGTPPIPQVMQEHVVTPTMTDASINTFNKPHYSYYHPGKAQRNKLLIFLPGTAAEPNYYKHFLKRAAELGYHAVGLMYANEPSIYTLCKDTDDITSHSRARLEIINGTDTHTGIQVNAANSIISRLTKLIGYLQQQYPTENWSQYVSGGAPVWNKILVSGHSQGAGHAGIMGKHLDLHRVIMFSNTDFLSNGKSPDWMTDTTRKARYFALCHARDELMNIEIVKKGWNTLGMGASADVTGSGFSKVQALQTNLMPAVDYALKFHNMTAVDGFQPSDGTLLSVWDYFLQ